MLEHTSKRFQCIRCMCSLGIDLRRTNPLPASVHNDSNSSCERKMYSYRRDALDCGLSELLPVLCLLFIMH
jgi:hypothetical protein